MDEKMRQEIVAVCQDIMARIGAMSVTGAGFERSRPLFEQLGILVYASQAPERFAPRPEQVERLINGARQILAVIR